MVEYDEEVVYEHWLEADGRRILTTLDGVPCLMYVNHSTVDDLKPGERLFFEGEFNIIAPGAIDELLEA